MPTEPVHNLLPPIDPRVELNLQRFGGLIDETLAYGTHVLSWHMKAAHGGDEIAPVTLSVRHILELLGAVSSCVRTSYIDPCKPLLRSMIESFFGLSYILKEDSTRRGFAFLAADAQERLKLTRRLDPTTPEGEAFAKALESDSLSLGSLSKIPLENIRMSISRIGALLEAPGVKEALVELKKVKKRKGGRPNWYSLYDGPEKLGKLADYLGYQSLYLVFYKYWSRTVHGTDAVQGKIARSADGIPGILQLRIPADAQTLTLLSISLALRTFKLVINQYCPERSGEYSVWYAAEIRPLLIELSHHQLIEIVLPT